MVLNSKSIWSLKSVPFHLLSPGIVKSSVLYIGSKLRSSSFTQNSFLNVLNGLKFIIPIADVIPLVEFKMFRNLDVILYRNAEGKYKAKYIAKYERGKQKSVSYDFTDKEVFGLG